MLHSALLRSPFHHSYNQGRLFSKYRFVLLLAGVVLLLSGCQKEDRMSGSEHQNLLNNAQNQNLKKKALPYKGKFTVDLKTGVATGVGTHIGRFTAVGQRNNENFPHVTGTSISTAANGDQIFTTDIGLFEDLGDGTAQANFECTITGGTGRFEGATGSYKTHGIVNFVLGTASVTFEGTITY